MNSVTIDMETALRLSLFAISFTLLAVAEVFWPRRRDVEGKWQRWTANLSLSVLNSLAVRLALPLAGVASAVFAQRHQLGLFNWLDWSPGVELLAYVVLFDFTIYWQHRLYHAVPVLWRFHRVHHTDPGYDLTTGNRFHPVSILISAIFKILLVLILGASASAVLISEILLNLTSMFNHSNLRLPERVDQQLRKVVVTPDMHRIHHSLNPAEHAKNFGFSFSCWDCLFRSYLAQPALGQDRMKIGILGFAGPDTRRVLPLLLQPLRGDG